MKNTLLKIIGTTTLAIFALMMFAPQTSVFAQDKGNEEKIEKQTEGLFPRPLFGDPQALVGTWDAQVTFSNCQTGAVIRTFASIGSFNLGGTSIGSTSGIPQSLRTPEHGVWNHINGRTFRFKFKSFSFDPGGNFTGWVIVTHTLELGPGRDSYTSAGFSEFFDRNGNPTPPFRGCSSAIGTRFE